MAVQLASGFIDLTVRYSDGMKKISQDLTGLQGQAGKSGEAAGRQLSAGVERGAAGIPGRMKSVLGKVTKVAGPLAVGATIGGAVMKGFSSAINQGTAERALSGLYGSTERASDMMRQLRDISSRSPIDGSAFRDAATSLAYAGVEGDKARRILDNVGLAITAIGGSSQNMDSMTDSITKMVNAGKVQLDSLQQLSGAGVPIISGLAEHFGVSMEEINKMASAGAIGLEDVLSVMENATGDNFVKALESGEQVSKSFGNQMKMLGDNIGETLGRGLTPLLESLAPHIGTFGTLLAGSLERGIAAFGVLTSVVGGVIDVLKSVADFVGRNSAVFGTLAAAVGGVAAAIGVALLPAFASWMAAVVKANVMATALIVKQTAMAVGAKAAAAAQWLWNVALRANPIGLIITAIAGLVAGLVYFFTQTETGRKIWEKVWGAIKAATKAVVDWFTDTAWPALQAVWEAVTAGWQGLVDTAQAVWDGVKEKFTAMVDFFKGIPGQIASAAKGMWDGIGNAFKSMVNGMIGVWNRFAGNMSFTTPDWIPGIGGKSFSMPTIPLLRDGGAVRDRNGVLSGPGTGLSDSILGVNGNGLPIVRVADGEGVVKTSAMDNGGAAVVAALNAGWVPSAEFLHGILPGFNTGGVVGRKKKIEEFYGLPAGTAINYGGKGFPKWVYDLADDFGVQASTYSGHQQSHRDEPGYAPNPDNLNRGIDWSGPVENMQALADYLAGQPGMEQVIWQNPNTGSRVGVAGGQRVGDDYYASDWGGHQDHVHTRQSRPIPTRAQLEEMLKGGGSAPVVQPVQSDDEASAAAAVTPEAQPTRTEGYMPSGAGGGGKAGESLFSSFLGMGADVINGLIDQAASAASQAAAAGIAGGTMGAGAPAAPAAAAATDFAIGMGTQAAKRGVDYGFQMAGIGIDAAAEILNPFGMPRLWSTDPMAFVPNFDIAPAAVTTAEEGTQAHEGTGEQPGPVQPEQPPYMSAPSIQDEWGSMTATPAGLAAAAPDPANFAGSNPQFNTTVNATVKDVAELDRTLADRRRLETMRYAGRPTGG